MTGNSNISNEEGPIETSDVRSIVRLLGQIAETNEPLMARKRHLMEGLSELVKADGWFWTLARVSMEHNRPVSLGMIHGGFTDSQIASLVKSFQSDKPAPEDEPLGREARRGFHFTRTRQQLIPDERWYSNPLVQQFRLNIGVDHYLYSIYPLVVEKGPILSFVGLYRNVGREPFSDRDRRITHIITSEIDWLHHVGVPEDEGVTIPLMSPRQRMTFSLLIEGHDRKAIARLLNISPNTAKEHIEAVYAHFGVSSQVELICRFSRGDGKDLPDDQAGNSHSPGHSS